MKPLPLSLLARLLLLAGPASSLVEEVAPPKPVPGAQASFHREGDAIARY